MISTNGFPKKRQKVVRPRATIQLNGKHYDPESGHIVHHGEHSAPKPLGGTHLDGFSARPRASVQHNAVHHKVAKSQTLRREVVKKPVSRSQTTAQQKAALVTTHAIDEKSKIQRAQSIVKSPSISRFGQAGTGIVKKFTHVLPVKEAPQEALVEPAESIAYAHPITVNPFHAALKDATAHLQPKLKKPTLRARTARKLRVSTKTVNFGAAVSAVLLLGAFFAYQNVPNFSMRVAAARSGVHATLPGYQPAGFALSGPIQAKPGQITLSYRSNSDDRAFTVTQQSSVWSNETLVEKYVAANNRPYQTYQAKDKTIYIYDQSNATWIDKGVWYQVEGDSNLNSDQLVRLASSL